MKGDFAQAREFIRDADAILDDLGRLESTVELHEAWIDMLAGQPAAAEARLLAGYHALEAMGEKSLLATTAAALAQAAFAQGHEQDAEEYCRVSERSAAADDLHAQATWRGVRARLLAQRKQFDSGEALAREAVELAKRTDLATTRADSVFDLAEVLDSAGRKVDAAAAIREALELYLEKGDVVSADRALSWLTARGLDSHQNGDQS
jgi:tetratricopeptide (TPR) repeat protein